MDAAADLLFGESGEPALDEVDPRGAGGRDYDVEARTLQQPPLDARGLVGAGVVENEVDVEVLGDFSLDCRKAFPEID